ncbi:MAG: T9SS type A sorting domain-containing protein [Bacteroidota bacterium]
MKLHPSIIALLVLLPLSAFAQNFQDCQNAFSICEKNTYHFDKLEGHGNRLESFSSTRCFQGLLASETNSQWLTWKVEKSGLLTFVINPFYSQDDFDFILFLKDGDCGTLKEVRCMASGNTIGDAHGNYDCLGKTGLNLSSVDDFEKTGCKYNDDNFLKFLTANEGEEYLLLINNYNSHGGFSVSIEGTAELSQLSKCQKNTLEEHIIITQMFPNPTSEEIQVQFVSKNEGLYNLQVLNVKGELVSEISNEAIIGLNTINVDVCDLVSNTYVIQVQLNGFSSAKRFVKS